MLFFLRRATATATMALQSRFPILSRLKLVSTQPNHTIKPLTNPQLKTLVLTHYKHGKFLNLIQNVVASPSVLLTACLNLNTTPPEPLNPHIFSPHFFSIQQMADEIAQNRFDFRSCCVEVPAFTRRVAKEAIVIEENNEVKKVNDDVNVVQEDKEVRSIVANEEIMIEDNTIGMPVQAKKENNDVNAVEGDKAGQSLEVNEDIMEEESKEDRTLEANVENNLENDLETGEGKSVAAKDVCMEDCDHADDTKKDEGEREGEGTIHESMEKSISGGDLPKSPAAL